MKSNAILRVGLLLVAALAAEACGLPGALSNIASEVAGKTPAVTEAAAISDRASAGQAAALPDPTAGLAGLGTYHAVLQIDIEGSLDGQPFQRSTQVEIHRTGSGDFDSRVQSSSSGADLHLLTLSGAYYRWSGAESTCEGSMDKPGDDEVIEPAELLLPLGAASRVGVETVNQVSAVHYRFDQTALPRFRTGGGVVGEFWVAENGGYVLRYRLEASAPGKITGKGLEVSQTYTYELTQDSTALALPEDCMPVPTDLPVAEGGQDVVRTGGLVTFETAANPRDVIDFYEQQLPGMGWNAEKAAPAGEVVLPVFYDFTKGGLRLTVNLTANEEQTTSVALVVVDAAAQAAATPHPTQTPSGLTETLPTIDPAHSGLPSNVPLYPGATSLMKAGGSVMFQSGDAWEDVADFYRKKLAELGWDAGSEHSQENGVVLVWNQDGKMLLLAITAGDGQTYITVTLIAE